MVETDRTFMGELCKREYWIKVVFAMAALFFLFHVPYPFVVDPGTALYVVATLNLFGTAAFMVASGWTIRKCARLDS